MPFRASRVVALRSSITSFSLCQRQAIQLRLRPHLVDQLRPQLRWGDHLDRRGRVALDMIVFTKYYDMSSPYLKKALFDNTPMDEVVFSARRTIEGETSDYLVITLTDASVMSYKMYQSEDEPDLIQEEVGFAYHAIKFVYDKDHEIEMSVRVGK